VILALLWGCATECPTGSSLADDGLCYLDADTGPSEAACEVVDGSAGSVVGEADCTEGRCRIPAGSFWMGEANPETPDRCPPREIMLSAYTIGEREVTVGEYAACVADGGCTAQPSCEAAAEGTPVELIPATCLTWQQASDYCTWTGGRLPTEAEWEKAARGEQGAPWAWGSQPPTCSHANFRFVTTYCHLGLVAAGSYMFSSAFGLKDTAGNAWEWTADFYDAGYYTDAPDEDPPGPETCRQTPDSPSGDCTHRVIRGGSYTSVEDVILGSARSLADPTITDPNIGFRCAW
jgi:formylglycine-generating enzyme required for sulfatase activity